MNAEHPQPINAESRATAQAYNEVECRKKEFFFQHLQQRQGIEEVGQPESECTTTKFVR